MKVVSLFSGAGGLDLGLIQAGMEIVWANDIFADAASTYRNNIGDHIDTRSICEIKSFEIPDCDVVVGGFPCQGFSVANWGRTMSDPRNSLYRELVRVVRDKRPRYFVGENVKGLASIGKGEILRRIVEEFEGLGYRVNYQVVNAADYGVPQARMRVIIVGVRKDVPDTLSFPPKPTHTSPDSASVNKLKPWFTVGKALAHFPEPEDGLNIPNHQCSRYKLRFNGHLGHRYIEADRPSPTVTARGDEKGGVVVLHHPNNHRRMTARELAAVQSFPDDFVFAGTKTSAYRQIANAVPPLLGKAIGTMLMSANKAVKESNVSEAA
ncbi:DNA cytosine methyltransferase [Asticcacaulis machinosus]|uniref:Cytosine-specific methyltransferase n=1 Tax=Asticcacaulis machinosus TaxID=2984211 RepID=A0ABT5HEY4_9CAUL|nr:DNA cytosine methyltransferase [Asticcacaulis machinosus]MDC7674695.1 DNA cytosine methyltransferase [Asticcacaulis machinosus]